jgi:hypothetical protein
VNQPKSKSKHKRQLDKAKARHAHAVAMGHARVVGIGAEALAGYSAKTPSNTKLIRRLSNLHRRMKS